MCDCFHAVLPTWPGAPGSASSRRLQPEELDPKTEEHSVTEGPSAEIIRPRPQGSSPVYECAAESAGLGLLECVKTTLKTKVEAGASGYSVAGGGQQGLFVQQVLQDSTAAKLFSLREGDQLLSATIFFDDIRYEDALKILQYSEPYKVQFCIQRKLDKQRTQEQDVTESLMDTPTKTLEGEGDQERLITKPRTGRGRRAQRERLSWPKFQTIKTKGRSGPRRSHSSSEAYERTEGNISPTSTDTEEQHPKDTQEMKADLGSRRRKMCINLGFRKLSGKGGPSLWPGRRESKEGKGHAKLQGENEPHTDGQEESTEAAENKTLQKRTEGRKGRTEHRQSHHIKDGDNKEAEERAHKHRWWTEYGKRRSREESEITNCVEVSTRQGRQEEEEEVLELEMGLARLSLQEKAESQITRTEPRRIQVQFPKLRTPKFRFTVEKTDETYRKTESTTEEKKDEKRTEKTEEEGEDTGGGDNELAACDSKLKKTKNKMASFRDSPGDKSMEDSMHGDLDVSLPKGQTTVSLPSTQDDIMVGELSAQLLSMDVDVKPGHVAFNIPEGQVPKPKIQDIKDGGGFKGHLSKVKTPSFKMPKIDMKAPKLDMKGPKTEFSNPNMEMTLPCAYMDLKAPETNMEADINLGDKQVATHDSEFKMPKFIMPSFGVSAESKSIEDSGQGDLDISITKAREDVSLPSAQSNIKASEQRVQISAMDEDIKLGHAAIKVAKGQTTKLHDIEMEGGLKGQLHKVETDSFKMPKVDLKTPQMEIKATGLDIKDTNRNLSSPSMEVMLPTLDMDLKVPEAKQEADIGLGDKEMSAHDSKFKMPKFKMPSFGESAAGKSTKVSFHGDLEVSQEALSLPSTKSDIKDSELSLHLPNVQVDVKPSKVAVKLPDGKTPEPEVPDVHMGGGLKDHLPDVKTHSFKMPKVDLKGPHVDIKGPKLDVKGPKAELSSPSVDLTLPSADVDLQAPEASLEADISLKDKDMTSRDSKFKMPKFKMPSYGGSATSKSMEASGQCDLEVSIPKVQADISLPSAKGDIKEGELSLQLPSVDVKVKPGQVDIKLPEGQIPEPEVPDIHVGGGLKGHLPQVKTPSFKMPKVDLKGPHVDIKGPKIDVKGPKAELSSPSVDLTLPSADVDLQAPEVSLEADIGLKDKDMTSRDSKFKMPKFKMPSFGGSATSKSMEASGQCDLEVSIPKVQADVSLPSAKGDIKDGELSLHLPSVDVEVKPGQVDMKLPEGQIPEPKVPDIHVGGGLKGHLPQVKTPSFKMPKVDLKGPHVDIKGPKLDVKGPKAELSSPSVDLTLPSADVDLQAPEVSLEADISLKDKDMTSLDSKFKMPKFKMPSFGGSATSKSMEASGQCDLEVSIPKVQADISLPSAKGDIKDGELSLQLPSVDVEVKPGQVDIKLPEAQMPEPEVPDIHVGGGLKGHLPQVKTPSFKMPKVDLKGPHVDIKGPKLDVKGLKAELSSPSMEVTLPHMDVDLQAPEASLDADIGLKDKDMTSRDSKFKMPKFKMPSFGGSATSKSMEASGQCDLEVSIPKVQADISLPSAKGDIKDGELSLHLPSVDVEVKPGQVAMKLPEGQMPEPEVPDIHVGGGLKGHLPQVKTPSFKMPKVDLKGPHVDIKGTKLDVKGPKAELSSPSVDLTLPSADVDMQAPEASLEADIGLKDKDMTSRDSKFKMPKFKMPSFGGSATSKSMEASGQCDLEVSIPKVQADISLSSAKGDIKDGELSLQLPSVDVEVKPGQVAMKLPEGQMPEPEVPDIHVGGGLKGHLPQVKTPSFKMPKVDLKGPHVDIKGPKLDVKGLKAELSSPSMEVTLPHMDVDLQAPEASLDADIGLKDKDMTSRESKFKMPKFKMPSFGGSATSKSMEASGQCDLEVSIPKVQADISLPSAKGDIKDGELSLHLPSVDVEVKPGQVDMKLPEGQMPEPEVPDIHVGGGLKGHLPHVKTPSFKMPKVDLKGPHVDIKGPKLDVKGPKAELSSPSVDLTLPSADVDLQAPEASLEADISLKDKDMTSRDSKFKMPKFKMPSFGGSATSKSMEASGQCDLEVSIPKVQADISLPSAKGDIKDGELSLQLPSVDVEVKPGQVDIKLPEAQMPEPEVPDIHVGGGLKGHLPQVKTPSFKMPKVDLKGPHVDIKGPKLDVKGPKAELSSPSVDLTLPSADVDLQAPEASLEADISLKDKDMTSRDSKLKMPKFKMPSFGGSATSKSMEASGQCDLEVSIPKVQADISLPSAKGDIKDGELSLQLPSVDVEVKPGQVDIKLPEAQMPEPEVPDIHVAGGLKGHLPQVKTPSFKMPKVDLKGPHVDIKGPKLDVKGLKAELSSPSMEVTLPHMDVDLQAPEASLDADIGLKDKDMTSRDSKFKMPKFKMPSFGGSATSKSMEASGQCDLEVSIPKVQADISLPSAKGDIKDGELSLHLPSVDVEVKPGQVAMKLPEGQMPEPEVPDIHVGGGLKGHLPHVKTPSFKMPKVDLKGPHVDIKGTKLDVKGPKAELSSPSVDLTLPSADVDMQAPEASLEADIGLKDKDMTSRDSKFKMPKFKMPSFGGSATSKSMEASGQCDLEVSIPKVQADISLPSAKGDIKDGELSLQLPSVDVEVKPGQVDIKLPEGQMPEPEVPDIHVGGGLKGHLPHVKTPSFKMPKVDLKGPHVDIKGPKLDVKGPKAELSSPSVDLTLPSADVDLQAPEASLEADISLKDKDMTSRDSKLKMPKFKMPSFGGSATSKSMEASGQCDLEVSIPKVQADISLPSAKGDIKDGELSLQLPSVDVEVKPGQVDIKLPEAQMPEPEVPDIHVGGGLKGHLPQVKTPSFKMPKVDLKGPHVDIKGPKLDVKGLKAELSSPSMEVTLPHMDVDLQAPEASLDADIGLKDKVMTSRDSKFKMPKFKMPSFGSSATSKSMEASGQCDLEVSIPKVQADISLPSAKGDIKDGELSLHLPSVDVEVKPGQVAMKLPEGQMPEPEVPYIHVGGGLKCHLPQVKTPSFKMPKVDLKGPHVDIKGPKLDVKGLKAELSSPSMEVTLPHMDVDLQAPEASLDADIGLKDKDMTSCESKFKMPKYKMPSFGGSATSKSMEASGQCDLQVSIPKVQADISLPSAKGDIKDGELSLHLPSVDVEVKPGQVDMKLPEGQMPEPEVPDIHVGGGLKGHLPHVKTPSFKMPKVDLKGPHVDIKGPKLDVKGPKAELSSPSVDLTLPSADVDLQAPEASLEADIGLKDKDMTSRDSKFKMPKFKMPSFGGSATSKSMEASGQCDLEVSIPKVQADISLPSAKGDIKEGELSLQLPSVDVEVKPGQVDIKLPEAQMPEPEVPDIHVGGGLKGHLPHVKTPSFKMPKVDLKGPHVDIKGPKLDVKGPKAELSSPSVDLTLPSADVDMQAPEASLDADVSLKDKDMTSRDSKFKMPKFKMPSFGSSATSKSMEASGQCDLEVSIPKVQADISLPSAKGDIKDGELSLQLPSVDVEVKSSQVDIKLSKGQMPEPEVPDIHVGGGLKGHLPHVKTPSFKMPKVDLKGRHVDIKGPKLDVKGPKAELSTPSVDLTLPSADVDLQAPEASLDADIGLKDKDMTYRESKFKMPKFKMPSFGGSATSKSMEASGQCDLEVSIPKVQADISLPSAKGDIKDGELSLHLPSVDVEVKPGQVDMKLPEGQMPEPEVPDIHVGGGLKGHLPHVKTPSFKMPKVDLKGPHVDIKGPKLDVKGPKAELSSPSVDLTLPSADVDLPAPEASLDADIGLKDKDMTSRESKFKMPKFKMPSFGSSATSKSMEASGQCDLEVSIPKVQADISLPSAKGDIKDGELSLHLPSVDVEVKPGQVAMKLPEGQMPEPEVLDIHVGGGLKGHLPHVKTPSFKMPKVDLKGPHVDIKGPKLDVKGPKAELSSPSVDLTLPSADVDLQAPEASLDADIGLKDKDMTSRDSKFKMPKFKMPSFGGSATSKSMEASGQCDLEVSIPKVQADISLPSAKCDIKDSELSLHLPSADVEVKPSQVAMKLPEGQMPEPEVPDIHVGGGLKGDLPHVKTPSFKMPKVDLKGRHIDIKGRNLDVKGPKAELSSPSMKVTLLKADVDLQAPEVSLEADIGLRNKEVTSRDSKFKMPKFKMPSFGSSATSKSMESSGPCDLEVTVPKVQADISLPSAKGVIKDGELSVQLPSMDIDVKPSHNVSKMPDAPEPEPEFLDHKDGASFKGHLPKVKAPSFKMPKVDLKAPQVDIKAPRVDVKSPKAELSSPSMEVTLPRADMDLQVPEANQEDDIGLGDKEISARDSKFKMPKFKIPSFRRSAEGKSLEASVHGDMDITQMAVSIPFIQGNINASEHSMPLSTMDMYVQPGHGTVNLPVVPAPEPELPDIEAEVNLKSSDAVSKILPVDNPQGDSEDVSYATLEGVLLSPVSSHTEPLAPLLPTFHGPVSFPKFHRPKFQYSAPRTVAAVEVPSGLGDPSMSGYCSSQRLDSSKIPVSAPQLLYSGDSVCGGMEQLPCIEGTLAATVGGLPSEGADRARKGSPLKMPRLKLPSFRWSPKKGAGSKGIPEPHLKDERLSVTVDMGGLQGETQVHILPDDMPPEANGEGNREYTLGNSGLAMPEPTVSPSEVPQGKIVLPPREPHPTLSRTLGTKSGIRDPGITVQHSLSQGNSEACDYTAFPESQPFGKPVICTSEKPLLPSCRPEDAEGPPASSTDGAASRESWFRVPPFRLPGLRRASSKDKGEDAGLKEVPRLQPAASKPKEQAPARPVSQGDLEEVAVSLDSSKRAADMASPNSASYADVLHCHLHSPSPSSGQHHLPTAEPSFLRAGPGESPPLLLTHVSFSEAPGPAAETVKRPGSLSSQSLSTQSPDPSYSWGMGGVWEDSQLKVRFPKLKVPKFTFPAPNSGADVFIPTVGEVWHPENCLLLTLQTENPEIRSATIMKAGAGHCKGQLEDCDSSSASPVSKVKVRIQDNQAESHAVTIHSRILASSAAHAGSEILTTEIVRESETPLSQKASYGFSLLKGRIPEPTLKASVHLEAQNSPRPGVPGTDSQEPFEIISSIREPTDAFEVGSGAQCADSCSDEEPAEILEFPPEDSPGTIMAEHSSPTEKPESRRSSGIFRFWFPNIGFSQSAPEEPRATSGMQGQQAGPVQKQPEARPETGLPGKQEKAGWFRFPKLGFSSPPAEKSQTTKDEAGLAEQSLQEERVTFYDAQESLSPGEEEEKGVTDDTMAVGSDSHRKGMRE